MPVSPQHSGRSPAAPGRERLEARIASLAESMVRRNAEALASETERIRAEAGEHLAAQCREIVALSRAMAAAEDQREARVRKLEQRLEEAIAEVERPSPVPLEIPRPRAGSGAVTNLWRTRD